MPFRRERSSQLRAGTIPRECPRRRSGSAQGERFRAPRGCQRSGYGLVECRERRIRGIDSQLGIHISCSPRPRALWEGEWALNSSARSSRRGATVWTSQSCAAARIELLGRSRWTIHHRAVAASMSKKAAVTRAVRRSSAHSVCSPTLRPSVRPGAVLRIQPYLEHHRRCQAGPSEWPMRMGVWKATNEERYEDGHCIARAATARPYHRVEVRCDSDCNENLRTPTARSRAALCIAGCNDDPLALD